MELPGKKVRSLLIPVSWIYGAATGVRNFLFDHGIIKSHKFAIPIICVGNLTVGGTGKTPHVEYLLRLLGNKPDIAVVSRGYRRNTKGMVVATAASTAAEIGDEPFQIKTHFPGIRLVADANRTEAIEYLMQDNINPAIKAVVLDDAFQHRHVSAGMNIMLTDYSRPVYSDRLLPAGMLRESFSQRRRAGIVIVSKCPTNLSHEERDGITEKLALQPHQKLFFTAMAYGTPYNVFTQKATPLKVIAGNCRRILALAGIARPQPFFREIAKYGILETKYGSNIYKMPFADHHDFSRGELAGFRKFVSACDAAIITTEKDAARLLSADVHWSEEQKERIYALPINVVFLFGEENNFNKIISDYVGQNK